MGEILALLTSVTWAGAVILFTRSGEHVAPFALNLFRVTVGSILLLLTVAATGGTLWRDVPWQDYVVLAASGIIGIAISDTLFHMCLNRVGAGITGVVDCLYPAFVVLIAYSFLGERLRPLQWGGLGLVLAGILVAGRMAPPPGTRVRTLVVGILIGVLAMLTLAVGITMAKPVLDRSPVLWATTGRQLGAFVVVAGTTLVVPGARGALAVFRPVRSWRYSLSGAILGSYLALVLWIAGMKYTQASIAATLNQTSTVFIVVLASVFLREPFSRRKAASVALAVAGILVVTLG